MSRPHRTEPVETEHGWRAICACGWEGWEIRADSYETDDPADTAYRYALADGTSHEGRAA